MGTKKKHIIISIIVACVIVGGILLYREHKARQPIGIAAELASSFDFGNLLNPATSALTATPTSMPTPPISITPTLTSTLVDIPIISAPPIPMPTPTAKANGTPKPQSTSKTTNTLPSEIGKITIKTTKSNKTYPIKRGVEEKLLKRNIGWMESSALPGRDGVCVIMGHRDVQLKTLKDIAEGDTLSIKDYIGDTYAYTVKSATIYDTVEEVVYPSSTGKHLVLITCYPFYYRGSAPQKIAFYAQMT